MSHADTLRGMAKAFMMVGSHERVDTCLAGADALDTLERVRAVLTDLRGQQEAALQRWDDTGDTWDGAVSDTLHDAINRLTEALEGEQPMTSNIDRAALHEQVQRQAAQIERLQAALKQAHEDEFRAGLDRYPTLDYIAPEVDEWAEDYDVLLPGDMEAPEVEA